MGIWTRFTGTISFQHQVEDDIYLMEDLIGRYSDIKLFKGTEISYHRQVSSRQPSYEEKPLGLVNRKSELKDVFKRQPNELPSTRIKAITLNNTNSENYVLDMYLTEMKDVITGLNEIFPIEIATFVFDDDLDTLTLTYAKGEFL